MTAKKELKIKLNYLKKEFISLVEEVEKISEFLKDKDDGECPWVTAKLFDFLKEANIINRAVIDTQKNIADLL